MAAALAIFVGVVLVIIYGYLTRRGWVGVADKRFWDYLELLIVPAALALGVYWLNRTQAERERQAEEAQQERERKAEEARREREREAQAAQRERELEVENQRAQDAALQAYFDQMSHLLTDKERPLRRAQRGDNLSTVARARTLSALRRLDGGRRGSVVQFLFESGLISGLFFKERQLVLYLRGADLSEANLPGALLLGVNLSETDLSRASLSKAMMNMARLRGANLSGADLSGADLGDADLTPAHRGAYPPMAANLSGADLSGAYLMAADLTGANLTGANLTKADLMGANLTGVNLTRANLTGADLRGTTLTESKGITEWELAQQTRFLDQATMPNGQKYEDWLKSKNSGEDKSNSSP